MTAQYAELVVEHFERPRNSGSLPAAPDVIEGKAGTRSEGTQFSFTARIDGEHIVEMRFQAFGCPHCIAAASMLTEQLIGAGHAQLARWQWRDIAALLDLPTQKRGRLLILEDALHALAENWRQRAQNRPISQACRP